MASHYWRSTLFGGGMLAVALCLSIVSANATVKPGDTIAPSNAAQVKELVSPSLLRCHQGNADEHRTQ